MASPGSRPAPRHGTNASRRAEVEQKVAINSTWLSMLMASGLSFRIALPAAVGTGIQPSLGAVKPNI